MINFDEISIRSGLISLDDNSDLEGQSGRAAVLVPLIEREGELCLLLTKRAINMRHHGGEIAFPGGMWEPGDEFPVGTALREAEEEIALRSSQVKVLGLLPALSTRQGTQVASVLAFINGEISLSANPAEIHSIFYVPLIDLLPENRFRTDIFGPSKWAPAYRYDEHEIWGFTASVIKLLLERCFSIDFQREHSAPEKSWF